MSLKRTYLILISCYWEFIDDLCIALHKGKLVKQCMMSQGSTANSIGILLIVEASK